MRGVLISKGCCIGEFKMGDDHDTITLFMNGHTTTFTYNAFITMAEAYEYDIKLLNS